MLWILLILSSVSTFGQFSTTARHIGPYATAPAHCSTASGDIYYNTTSKTPFYCSATDTWTAMGGGGGGGSPAGSDTQVQFNNTGSFGANVNFAFQTGTLELGDSCCFFSIPGMALNIESILTSQPELVEIGGDFTPTTDFQATYGTLTFFGTIGGASNITSSGTNSVFSAVWSNFLTRGYNSGTAFSGTCDRCANLYLQSNLNNGTITQFADIWIAPGATGGTNATNYGLWMADKTGLATNIYYSWFDSQGVARVREDTTFNSVGQAISALYNPQVTKYTPGAANYERCIPGCQWESNVAVITTEKGGSGTLRDMQLGDAGVHVLVSDLKTTGAATGKKTVCVDTSTGRLYASSTGTDCSN